MPFFGYFNDRVNRVTALAVGMFMAGCAYLSMMLIDNPLDPAVLPIFAFLGIGQISGFHASQALIGQEAPKFERGAVIGFHAFCAAIGIMLATVIGGRLFDSWMPAGPFVLVGAANLVVCLLAVVVRIKWPGLMITKAVPERS